ARRLGDAPRGACSSLALGRCLFWKGQYAESAAALPATVAGTMSARLAVRITAAASRAAVGMGDLPRAMSLAHDATEWASRDGDPALLAAATCAAAFVHLAVGDVAA